jgi:hypothetical protein
MPKKRVSPSPSVPTSLRKAYDDTFKVKVVLEALQEASPLSELASKYEDVYIKEYETVVQCCGGLAVFFERHSARREHQALGYRYPKDVFREGLNYWEAA